MKYEKRDNAYHAVTDKDSYELTPCWIGEHIRFSKVSRVASGGFDSILYKNKGLEYSRCITADWEPKKATFELLDETAGEKRVDLKGKAFIKIADFKHSNLFHFEGVDDHPECMSLNLYLSEEWFNWLWQELGSRGNPALEARIHITPWLAAFEASMWYDRYYRPIRVERGGKIEVLDVDFHVGDFVPEEKEKDAQPTTLSGRLERELESTDAGVWAKRIFWVLIVIAGILYFRGHA